MIRLLFQPFRDIDLIYVGFYGHPLTLFPFFPRKTPLVFDVFLSTFEVLCYERKLYSPSSIVGKLALWLDKTSCARADLVLLHTEADFSYFHQVLEVPLEKLRCLYIGNDEDVFYPRPEIVPEAGRVLFYGSFIPNQGLDTIIRAAAILKSRKDITFRLIGKGMDLAKIMEYAQKESLVNVEFVAPMSLEKIAEEVAGAEVILTGEFGDFDKARRVISSKTFQCMAMGKPFIAGDNVANRELLQHRRDAMLCRMNDPVDLAKNIEELIDSPRLKKLIGRNALLRYQNTVSNYILKGKLKSIINELL